MAKLKVTKNDGNVQEYEITPVIEYSFEQHFKKGFHKSLVEDQLQSSVYWLCWEAIRRSGETVKPFGEDFISTLKLVEVLESDFLG
tara:strand:+ start:76 stop:333 length:258 start_codon:yes stop_codon:yes gene_type:complete